MYFEADYLFEDVFVVNSPSPKDVYNVVKIMWKVLTS